MNITMLCICDVLTLGIMYMADKWTSLEG